MKIEIKEDNVRLDKYLSINTDYTRSTIQKMIKEGYILVNDNKVKSNYVIKSGDKIYIDDSYTEQVDIKPEDIKLDIYYEDEDIIVVNKPSGMVVHPGAGNNSGTLVNALMNHCNSLSDINGDIRPGIVHRIDADTSGLLLVAKTNKAHNDLASQIANKSVLRKYIALVHGIIKEDSATIDAPIGRSNNDRKKMMVTDKNSKEAITHIKVLERYSDSTLIECTLETGRTHQIRVHTAYINHPVVNDPVYGYNKLDDKEFGQMLHAKTIGFIHPVSKKYMEFTSPVPDKFNKILDKYKNRD